jgi:hypothetical protein
MVYSICILDLAGFKGIGEQIPDGIGIDASVQGGISQMK